MSETCVFQPQDLDHRDALEDQPALCVFGLLICLYGKIYRLFCLPYPERHGGISICRPGVAVFDPSTHEKDTHMEPFIVTYIDRRGALQPLLTRGSHPVSRSPDL
ncbi:uncharacterized protein LOC143434522 [Arvicanthis niloticus]|uniref:uncharacterized protein LOC143308817 n=1 Tax=Arvicanthis niloticus TaxID=61156 RepID=UPI00402B2A6E